jgi:sugar (pentulose or hexulose) kinase
MVFFGGDVVCGHVIAMAAYDAWTPEIPYAKLVQSAAEVPAGSDGLVFLPYLVGERAPIMDPQAKGGFVGLSLYHGTGDLVRAVLEQQDRCLSIRDVSRLNSACDQ